MADYLVDVCRLTPGLEQVTVVRSIRELGKLDRPKLVLKTDSFEKLPAAPMTRRIGHFTATLISPHQDIDEAEDQLDELLEILLPTLFTFGLSYEEATQVGYGNSNLAYDIRINSILTKEKD